MIRIDHVLLTDALLAEVDEVGIALHAALLVPDGYSVVWVNPTGQRGDGGWWFDVLSRPIPAAQPQGEG